MKATGGYPAFRQWIDNRNFAPRSIAAVRFSGKDSPDLIWIPRQCTAGGIAVRVGVLRKWEACLRPEASDSAIMRATTEPPWLVTPEKVHAVVGRLIEMANPKQIILFGSYARGKITEDSDLDVLIVAGDEVENTRRESVRLRGALKEIEMPIDIVVVRESTFRKLSDTPGLIYEEARRTGLLVYECES